MAGLQRMIAVWPYFGAQSVHSNSDPGIVEYQVRDWETPVHSLGISLDRRVLLKGTVAEGGSCFER